MAGVMWEWGAAEEEAGRREVLAIKATRLGSEDDRHLQD